MSRAPSIRQCRKRTCKPASRSARAWLLAALTSLAIAAAALGCGWPTTDHSVRFNAFRSAKEFGRLPRLSRIGSAADKLFSWSEEEAWRYDEEERESKRTDRLWDEALEVEQEGSLAVARKNLREYLQRTTLTREAGYGEPTDFRRRRNSAFDKLDALATLDQGAREDCVRAYLQARTSVDNGQPNGDLMEKAGSDARLKDNVAYLYAVVTYQKKPENAAIEFGELAAHYPRSEKREAALYMSALARLKWALGATLPSEAENLPADCDGDCRKSVGEAQAGFRRVLHDYPKGRLYSDAQGWIAYISLKLGDRPAALAEYYRMLGDRNEASRIEALYSLAFTRDDASDADMARVEKLIENEPDAALAYAYHNIYNFALESLKGYDNNLGKADRYENNINELKRIVAFATRMLNRYGSNAAGSGFMVRVAEASLELGNDQEAARLARRALNANARADIRAEALWIEGVAHYHLKHLKEARAALAALVAENPNNRYTEGARRNLAMIAEDMNDLDGALEQYLALDYRLDVAYLVDVLMPTDQLAAFVKNRPLLLHMDELQYALGVRYLRDHRWNDARQTLMVIRTVGRGVDYGYRNTYVGDSSEEMRGSAKKLNWDERIRGIRPEWIEQDLRTASDLERLEQRVKLAEGDEAKAEALYQLASYHYQGNLLFYNPAWNGTRYYHLFDLDDSGCFRRADESRRLFDYMQKHDAAATALPLYLEVADRYPKTRAAQDALYTAACCHERLANYNNYWRAIYERGGFAGNRMVNYKDVRRAYPGYHFPLGTIGWEPATRTVNGEPGWPIPPKPKPRPSRTSRLLARLNLLTQVALKPLANAVNSALKTVYTIFQAIWKAVLWLCHWLWLGYLCFWLRFVWRRSREARSLVRDGLARYEPRPAADNAGTPLIDSITPQPSAIHRYLGHDWRDQLLKRGYDLLYKVRQMALEKNARHALLLLAATHFMLIIITFKLLADW